MVFLLREQKKVIGLNKYKNKSHSIYPNIALPMAPSPAPTPIPIPKIIPAGGQITVATPSIAAIPVRKPAAPVAPTVLPIAIAFPVLVGIILNDSKLFYVYILFDNFFI